MPSFEFRGCKLRYELNGEGQDLILLHGLGADRRQVRSLCASLKGYRLISIDMPGHGESVCVDVGLFGFRSFADIALALLDKLKITSALWGGISMGCGISLAAALQQPDRVEALLLVRPAWLDGPALPHLNLVSEIGHWIEDKGIDCAQENLNSSPLFVHALEQNPIAADSIAGLLTRPQAVVAAAVLPALVLDYPFDSMEPLGALKMPALILGNSGDPLHPHALAKTLAGALPRGKYIHLPSRYLDPVLHQQALVQAVENFLEQTPNTTLEVND